MGVAGLWDVLRPAAKNRSLTELAVNDGFVQNPDGVRGYRLGIDASIWFFHAEYGKEGENPVLRTLFFRCATLMKAPFLPLFVFDGPKRPDFKRGKKVNKTPSKLIPGMKRIVEAFGFEHRTAPGEAEAELAYLNDIGVIDGILSDDVDNFLFGAKTVVRNSSNNLSGNRAHPALNALGKDDKNHSWSFKMSDITELTDLTRGGLILIGLLSGGDYHNGVDKCGIKIAVALARCGFGDTLYQAAQNLTREALPAFLSNWRHELRHELTSNSRGIIGRKSPSLAKNVTAEFPDIDVLLSYANPVTSKSMGRPYQIGDIKWEREPDIGKLAGACEQYFEWGYKEAIVKRFRTVIWPSAILRILRRAVLDHEVLPKSSDGFPSTPSRRRRLADELEPCGTPSKMIARHFSTMNISDRPATPYDEDERLIIKVHKSRRHASTDEILEYRLQVDPSQLVRFAEAGVMGLRQAEGPDEWASEEGEDDDEGGGKKGTKKGPVDPYSHLRVWMPACMVELVEPRLVEDFKAETERKELKKAGKGLGRAKAKKATDKDESDPVSPPKKRAPAKTKASASTATGKKPPTKAKSSKLSTLHSSESEDDSLPVVRPKPKAKTQPQYVSCESDDDLEPPTPSRLFSDARQPSTSAPTPTQSLLDTLDDMFGTPSQKRREGVRAPIKKKTTTTTTTTTAVTTTSSSSKTPVAGPSNMGIKSFYSTAKSTSIEVTSATTKVRASSSSSRTSSQRGDSSKPSAQSQPSIFAIPAVPPSKTGAVRVRSTSSDYTHAADREDDRIHKSPRKSKSHIAPSRRAASPSPTRTRPAGTSTSKRFAPDNLRQLPVIIISSDEDEDDLPSLPVSRRGAASVGLEKQVVASASVTAAPPAVAPAVARPETPPIQRARARRLARKDPPANVIAFVDLT